MEHGAGSFDFYDLETNYINKNGYTRYWNDIAKVPYLYNATNKRFISYDDAESIGYKTAYIKSKGLGGAMFWELSGDRNKTLQNKLKPTRLPEVQCLQQIRQRQAYPVMPVRQV